MKRYGLFIILFALCLHLKAQFKISNLRVEHMENPSCVDNTVPRFSWINEAAENSKGERQIAYRIVVASSLEGLNKGEYDVWDSGKRKSSESVLVPYEGMELQSAKTYFWRVMTWNKKGKRSKWSDVGTWGMGLLNKSDWKAKWISSEQETGAPLFRKGFDIYNKVKEAKVFVTAGGYFELYMNGQRIGDDYLSPNFTNYTKRDDLKTRGLAIDDNFTAYRILYLSYDVTSLLQHGKNAIGAILGDGFYRCNSVWVSQFGTPCLLCQIMITYEDGSEEVIGTDESWQTKPSAILMDGVYAGEIYDATKETANWNTVYCDTANWTKATIIDGPCGELTAQTSPTDKITKVLQPKSVTHQDDGTYLVDFGIEVSGWVRLKDIKAQKGDTIRVKYLCESPLGIEEYIAKGSGNETYAPRFTWYVFSKVVVSGLKDLGESNIQSEAVNTDVKQDCEFYTSNSLFNKINEIWQRSQLDNMHGCIASDCPHRERSPYTGDGQIASATVMLNFDAASFYQKWIRDIRDSQNKETGYVPNGAPWQPACGGGVAWGAAMDVMPWEYYLQYGDKKMLEDSFEAMKAEVGYMQTWQQEDGTMFQKKTNVGSDEPNYWFNLGDWSPAYKNPEDNLVHTFYLWLCARNVSLAAKALGNQEDAAKFDNIANRVRDAFHKHFYKSAEKTYGDYGSNIYALYMGGMSQERHDEICSTLRHEIMDTYKGHLNTGFIATKFFFEVLSDNGMHDVAVSAMSKTDFPSYGNWIKQGATVTWEQWDGGNSRNHPMFGGGLTWFYRRLAGLKVDENGAGYKHFTVKPFTTDGLENVHYSKMTPQGKVVIDAENKADDFTVTVTVPVGSTATVILPDSNHYDIEQGTYTFKNGK